MANGGNHTWSIGLNTESLKQGIDKAKKMFMGLGDTAKEAGAEADEAIENLKSSLASLAAGVSLSLFAKKMAEVRGEVQQLEVAFETMLGSKERADQLIAEVTELAAKTPFGLEDVSSATKMLLAFGSTAEEVAGEITMLGDIASGLSIPLNDMIFLYGSTRTQGQMFTQDLRQFMSRGIPLADELAKIFGVTKAEVGELVTKGEVGFEQMAQALSNMTSEGGQFAGLMEKQSQTIAGQISAIEDAIYQMFNELGEKNEGLIGSVLSGTSWAIENYEKLLKVIVPVITAYGAYKAAVIAIAAVQKVQTIIASAQAFFELAKTVKTAKDAMLLFNMATSLNPWAIIAAGVISLITAFAMMGDETEELTESTNAYMEARDAAIAKEDEHKRKMEELARVAGDEAESTEDRRRALVALEMQYPNIFAQYDTEVEKLNNIKRIKEEIAAFEAKNSIANPAVELKSVNQQYDALLRKYREIYGETFEFDNVQGDLVSNKDWKTILQLQQRQKELNVELFKLNIQDIISNADTLSDEAVAVTLEKLKAERGRRNRVAAGKYDTMDILSGRTLVSDLTTESEFASWNDDFIQAYIQSLESVKAERAKPMLSAQQRVEAAAKAWADAEKEYEDFKASQTAMADKEYQEKLKQLDDARTAAKAAAEAAGASTTKSGAGGAGKGKQSASDAKAKELERNLEQAAELAQQLTQQNIDDETALMEEGVEKKLEQIDNEYARRMAAITKNEAELRKLQSDKLTEAQQAELEKSRQLADQKWEADRKAALDESMTAELRAMDEYLIKFGTLQEKIRATKSKYERDIAEALTEGERKTIEAERDAALAELELQAMGFAKTLTNKSIDELNKLLKGLEAQVKAKEEAFAALETSDSEEAQEYLKIINELKAQIAVLKGRVSEVGDEVKDSNWTGAAQVLQGISSAASTAASSLRDVDEGLAGALSTIAEFTGVAGSLVSAIAAITADTSALNTALGVIGLIAAAVQTIALIAGKIAGINKEYEQTIENFKALNKELAQMRELAKIDALDGTIFGKDAFGNFTNNLKVMRDAAQALSESQDAVISRGKELTNVLVDFQTYGIAIESFNWGNIESSLKNMQVLVKDRSFFAERWGFRDKYESLGDMLPELFGDEGVTLEGLKKLRENDVWEKLSEENRDLIDEMIADWEVFEKATESVNEYLTDVFGELGNSINDAIVDAFANGTDAALAFGDIAGEVIENLIKQVGYSTYIAPILTQAMADVEALNDQGLSAEEYLNALMGIVGKAMDDAEGAVEGYNEFLENADQYAESRGINTFDSERSAQRKGIAQASQDSVDELNGRMTAIQGHTYSLVAGQRQLINDTAQVLRHLAGIESNTAELRQMRQDMSAMRSDISDIATRGIITR